MADRLLLRGGAVVSMDPDVGNLPKGDILIEGDKIVQIAPNIQADAQVMDVTGDIVIPGFIDTHRHTWECAIRGCAPNATLDDYFVEVLDTFAPLYRPDDVYASNLAGALECINAGITTLLDWSHINNTPTRGCAACRSPAFAPCMPTAARTCRSTTTGIKARSSSPKTTCAGFAIDISHRKMAC